MIFELDFFTAVNGTVLCTRGCKGKTLEWGEVFLIFSHRTTMSNTQILETQVLISGGGPSGLMLANELGLRGVSCILLDAKPSTAFNPQANATQARTMEHYRRLGFAHEIRSLGLPSDHPTDIAYFTRLTTYELARLSLPTAQEAVKKIKDLSGSWSAAELPHRVSQKFVETVLKRHAEKHPQHSIRYGWRLKEFTDHGEHISAFASSIDESESVQIKAQFLIGADGPKSFVRHQLGFAYEGETGVKRDYMGGQMFAVYLRSKTLLSKIPHPKAWMYVTVNPERRCFLACVDGHEEFAFHSAVLPGENADDWGLPQAQDRLKELMGCEVDFEMLSHQTWTAGHSLVANHFSKGRVFLMGDAVHLFTPTGGLGYNTAIEDAVNLGWKLASVLSGKAHPKLLESYELERKPLAQRNINYARGFADSVGLYPVTQALEEDSPHGADERARASEHFNAHARLEFNIPGVTFGGRYDLSPVIVSDGTQAPKDQANVYEPSATPGGRPPHAWMSDSSSLYDHFGAEWTLLNLSEDEHMSEAWTKVAKNMHLDLKCLHLPLPQLRELYVQPLVVIRPDQIVGWRGGPTQSPETVFKQLLGF